MIQADQQLLECMQDKVSRYATLIAEGKPYVWQLRLSLDDYSKLEQCLEASVDAHSGNHSHLLTHDFALLLVIYLAEWYKRKYNGTETGEDSPVVTLAGSDERKQLWEASGIDTNIFVYNASNNPDKPNRRWQESLQVLGGLAIHHELRRDESDPFLSKLCKIYHGEDVDISDIEDHTRAVAFQQSIAQRHSLYEYVAAVLSGDYPFDQSDLVNSGSICNRLIRRLQGADKLARKDKFEFEWLINYSGYHNQLTRQLRLHLKPEEIGGGLKQYLGYDRLRDFWEIDSPETIGRLVFDLRFKNGTKIIQGADFSKPLLAYINTFSEKGGFLLHGNPDEIDCREVPLEPFTSVELVVKYDTHERMVQSLDCSDGFLQVYKMPKTGNRWTSRKKQQASTAVIFTDRFRLQDTSIVDQVLRMPYARNGKTGMIVNWCPIYDQITLLDDKNKEYVFYNRSGFYQVVARQYLNTIKYQDNLYVTYKYVDLDESELNDLEDDDYMTDLLPVLFGREGLMVCYYPSRNSKDWRPVESYDLEYKLPDGNFIDWKKNEPKQGKLQLRITVKGYAYLYKVYYVPFVSSDQTPLPIWRDFNQKKICFAIDGQEDMIDKVKPDGSVDDTDTLPVTVGSRGKHILVDVYRPVLLKELFQNNNLVEVYGEDDNIDLPLLIAEQFKIRHFSREGVETYDCSLLQGRYYPFNSFEIPKPNIQLFSKKIEAKSLNDGFGVDKVNVYLTKQGRPTENLYAWDFTGEPLSVVQAPTNLRRGLTFQSLKNNPSPRHYIMPIFKEENIFMKKSQTDEPIDLVQCFLAIATHKVYFFLFEPMRKVVYGKTMIQDIILPLIMFRNGTFTEEDIDALYRFAREFHFDWMLLPREQWETAINDLDIDNEEKQKTRIVVTDFFMKTPKCAHEQEQVALKDFLNAYWIFKRYSTTESIAIKALKLILGESNALSRNESWDEYLKSYDYCRYKFVEMSKVITIDNQ